ncbi:tyrosine-protein phosphatase non-receptor type 14 [Chironomus tepperi]|uniref:tyrosine-protein phosphatase non-receptor type 14 n=1 Tax=Chironomus tepperi TaxID=113505 RepID=UPI00391FC756
MPFKILKKSRQYNVMSKDLYVISVLCLDGNNIDCTLSSESKGSECLENVCQRAGLNQSEFFGLKYSPKGTHDESDMRWVDLDRPLNRQLEKYAANTKVLHLRIMYYVISGVSLIADEQTRNYYFLQLKQDIIEGRISCDAKQAIILANYSRQAEYGNYQDRHKSVDYLKSLLSFPKHLIEAGMLEVLTEEVILHENEVHDVTQRAAEELYISLCQQLDGYGQETFMARNDDGKEVLLGISVSGVIVSNAGSHKFYPWREIVNVVNHKRTFSIECTDSNQNVSFTLPDAESGRYIWKLCVNQHTFFMNFEQNHASQVNLSLFQNIPEHYNESREDLLSTDEKMYYSNTHLAFPHNSNTNLTISTNNMYVPSSESLHNPNPIMESRTSLQTSSILDINHPMNSAIMGSSQWNHAGSNTSLVNRAQSSSCIDLTNNNNNNNNNVLSASKERFLPKYRPAPAYEIAIQQKYKGQQEQQDVSIPKPHLMYENFHHHHQQNQQPAKNLHYPDVTHITHHASNNMINPSYVDASDYLSQRLNLLSFNPPTQYPANRLSSTSTPDLALASHRGVFGYRHTGSSPDLLSRTLLHQHGYIPSNPHSIVYPYSVATSGGGIKQRLRHSHSFLPHATYENLNFIEATNNNPKSFFPSSKHIPNNMIYRTASSVQQLADMEYYLHKQQRNHSLNALNLSNSHISEPIYENVPLPMNNASTTTPINVERKISTNENRPVRPRPRLVHTEPSIDVVVSSSVNTSNNINMVNANAFSSNNNNGSTKNINDPLNGNEIASNNNNNRKHFILTSNNDNNGNKISGSAISITNISALNERDHTSAIQLTPSSSSSPFHIENMQINKQRQVISSNALPLMNTSGTSSNYTINTATTADTTDSGISTEMSNKKESKRNKFWAILGKNKSSSSKQKSATLGREKDKNKKDKGREMNSREMHDNTNHRWSTGLQGRHPLPISTISKEKLCQLLDAKLNDSQLFLEFERIPKRKTNAQYSCALMEENRNKNSDNTCLPMDENRVRLTPTRDNRMGYFNASHISSTVGQKQRFYIAAQSASNTFTANIFWQGVWEADVYLLIQLTDEFVYVPSNSDRCSEYGQYQVWREFSQETNGITTSKLRIYHTQSRRYRSVWHVAFYEFNEQNYPKDLSQFLKFLEELNSVRLASISEVPVGHNSNPPVLFHCTDGERTGLTLVADLLLYTLDHNQDLDIPRVIGQLREQRDKIIPSLVQYKFIYEMLIHYLNQTRLI